MTLILVVAPLPSLAETPPSPPSIFLGKVFIEVADALFLSTDINRPSDIETTEMAETVGGIPKGRWRLSSNWCRGVPYIHCS